MRITRLELVWYFYRGILSPLRLPIPPYPHNWQNEIRTHTLSCARLDTHLIGLRLPDSQSIYHFSPSAIIYFNVIHLAFSSITDNLCLLSLAETLSLYTVGQHQRLATPAGFDPAYHGVKFHFLTAWRRGNINCIGQNRTVKTYHMFSLPLSSSMCFPQKLLCKPKRCVKVYFIQLSSLLLASSLMNFLQFCILVSLSPHNWHNQLLSESLDHTHVFY